MFFFKCLKSDVFLTSSKVGTAGGGTASQVERRALTAERRRPVSRRGGGGRGGGGGGVGGPPHLGTGGTETPTQAPATIVHHGRGL